jgi:hypothetical protein
MEQREKCCRHLAGRGKRGVFVGSCPQDAGSTLFVQRFYLSSVKPCRFNICGNQVLPNLNK